MTKSVLAAACFVCLIAGVAAADDVNGAAKAFSQGQEAMLAGDPGRAAEMYELADELAPSAPALRNAARARLGAGHEAMAATDAAELLRRYSNDKESREVAEAILSQLSAKLSHFEVTCSEDCTVTLDGKAASSKPRTSHIFYAQPGARTIGATFDGGRQTQKQVTAMVGGSVHVTLDAPARPQPAPPIAGTQLVPAVTSAAVQPGETSHGIRRTWVLVGAAMTVALGVGGAVEGMATLDTRDQIKAATTAGDTAHAQALYDQGRDQQLRTNLLFGATAAAGITTVILAVVTDWSGGEHREVAVRPVAGGGATLVLGGRF
jgi:hypothetical protein